MPLSDHEQRLLEQMERALYAEDPKFASSVRGAHLRTPSTRRRLQGVGMFLLGLAMLVSGVAIKATMIGGFPVLSVLGFVVTGSLVTANITNGASAFRILILGVVITVAAVWLLSKLPATRPSLRTRVHWWWENLRPQVISSHRPPR